MTGNGDQAAKAAFLYLDVDDEITSAVARIRAATDEKVALVLPYGSRLATSRINFRLLAREAEAQGRGLEIVAADPAARALAAAAGLTVHPTVAALEDAARGELPPGDTGAAPEDAGGPPPGGPPAGDAPTVLFPALAATGEPSKSALRRSRKARAAGQPGPAGATAIPSLGPNVPVIPPRAIAIGLAILLVAIIVGGAAAFTFLPTATIVVTPETRTVGPLELTITADPAVTEPDVGALLVPARTFTYDVAATQTFPATGVRIEEATASGSVTFENCSTQNANIPQGTLVGTTSDVLFSTTARIRVDGALPFFPCPQESVGIVALAAGPGGNVAANTITRIPASESELLRVTNPKATTGGKHDEFPVIKQEDVDAALAALNTALAADFDAKLADTSQVPEGTDLFLQTKALGASTPSVDPATFVGKEQPEFELGLTAQGTVIGVDPAPLDDIADVLIRDEVPSGFTLLEASIDIVPGEPVVDPPTVRYPVTVHARATRDVDVDALLAEIAGKPLHEARLVLDEVGTSTIEVWPDWVTTIPTMDGRVTITVDGEASPSPTPSPSP